MNAYSPPRLSLEALSSLRFFAAVLVVLAHFRYTFWPADIFGTFDDFSPIVSFFFMLSGFTMFYSHSNCHPPSFLLKRISRIWPIHALVLLLTFLLLPRIVEQNMQFSYSGWILTANLLLLQSWIPVQDYFFSFNTPTWYLSTQMAMYLAFPWLAQNFHKNWPYKLFFCLFLVLVCLGSASLFKLFSVHTISGQGILYVSPICRLLEFVIGMIGGMLCTFVAPKYQLNRFWGSVIEVVALLLVITAMAMAQPISASLNQIPYFGNLIGFYCGFAGVTLIPFFLLMLVFAMEQGSISRLLCLSPFKILGKLSFGIYMVHILLLQYYLYPIALKPHIPIPSNTRIFIYWGILLLIAFLSERFFEKPLAKSLYTLSGHLKKQ